MKVKFGTLNFSMPIIVLLNQLALKTATSFIFYFNTRITSIRLEGKCFKELYP